MYTLSCKDGDYGRCILPPKMDAPPPASVAQDKNLCRTISLLLFIVKTVYTKSFHSENQKLLHT